MSCSEIYFSNILSVKIFLLIAIHLEGIQTYSHLASLPLFIACINADFFSRYIRMQNIVDNYLPHLLCAEKNVHCERSMKEVKPAF